MSLAETLAAACLSVACLGLIYLALATALVARMGARPAPSRPGGGPGVTILKPLHGDEPELFENLDSFCRQDYPGPVQLILGVQSPRDPAIAVARRLAAAYPALRMELVVDARLHGTNRKVSNLANMEAAIRHEIVVLADSDMRVRPDYLDRLVAELAEPGVGAVTCLYHGRATGSVWSRLSALWIDTHFLPGVAVGTGLGLAKPCFGSTIALRRETLHALGGFRRVADDLADDHALGAAVRELGLRVAIPSFTVGHACPERSFRELARQELRWQRTIRQIEPAGHLGSALSHPFAFACLGLLLEPGIPAFGIAAGAVGLRYALCLAVERSFGLEAHPYRLIPLRDLLSFGLFVASFLGRGVSWRGHRYDVAPGGALIPKVES
jgi:ceramide glucosyltransferase